jgi:hypothetical protein
MLDIDMRRSVYFFLIGFLTSCHGQEKSAFESLVLVKEVPMPSVKGRLDHMAINPRNKTLFIAALGNNTVEVIDLERGAVIHSIKGVEEPQGVIYLAQQDEIAVASGGTGDCVFFNATTFQKLETIHLGNDADNIRYDSASRTMYVGYGNGGMAVINPVAHKLIGSIKLPGHPESFQLNKKTNKMYVNVPDDHSIVVVDLKQLKVANRWKIDKYRGNFPMAIDTSNNVIFVGFRRPAVLVGYNGLNGNEVWSDKLVDDVDDIFFYPQKQEIVVSGGGGSLNIFKKVKDEVFGQVADVPIRKGTRTSLLIPSLRTLVLAERASVGKAAAVAVYTIKD